MWKVEKTPVPGGFEYRVREHGTNLSFQQCLTKFQSCPEFADWYAESLAAFEADAFYWELPPLTRSSLDDDARFVLIDAPMLARLPVDPSPFAEHFDNNAVKDVIVFPNLGNDAMLVVPTPRGPLADYPHFAAFLRKADREQVRSLWRVTAETVLNHVSDKPTWVSTAGGGVFWLHLRLDSRPKYYQHRPYTPWLSRA